MVVGYSDGAGLANYLGTYRSHKVIAVISYAGRLQRNAIETTHKYPVLDVWNEKDGRYGSDQHLDMVDLYEDQQHEVTPEVVFNRRGHYRGWDAMVNDDVIDFVQMALGA